MPCALSEQLINVGVLSTNSLTPGQYSLTPFSHYAILWKTQGSSLNPGPPTLELVAWAPVTMGVYSMEMEQALTFYSAGLQVSKVTE